MRHNTQNRTYITIRIHKQDNTRKKTINLGRVHVVPRLGTYTLAFPLKVQVKGKAVPLQALGCPEGSRILRFPDFVTTAQDGGKIVSLMHRPLLPVANATGIYFC